MFVDVMAVCTAMGAACASGVAAAMAAGVAACNGATMAATAASAVFCLLLIYQPLLPSPRINNSNGPAHPQQVTDLDNMTPSTNLFSNLICPIISNHTTD